MADAEGSIPSRFMTSKEVAKLLRVSVFTIDSYRRKGLLPAVKIGYNTVLYEREMLEKFIDSRRDPRHGKD